MAEIPEFKKCCFYIPLRRGLIIWGYISVILSLVMLGVGLNDLRIQLGYDNIAHSKRWRPPNVALSIMIFLAKSLPAMLHLAFSLLLVVAGHKTNPRLLNICYNYAKYRIIVYAGAMVVANFLWLNVGINVVFSCLDSYWLYIIIYNPALGIIDILLQGYFVLLLRSYLLTFENKCQFKPLRNDIGDTEADCTLEIERNGQIEKIIIKNVKIRISN